MRSLPLFLFLAACSTPTAAPALRHLERPGDVAFGCITTKFIDGVSRTVALPPATCSGGPFTEVQDPNQPGPLPDAQVVTGQLTAFVLEPVRGDVTVVSNPGFQTFVDSDKFSPGSNGVPVGRLPTAITTSTDGCRAVVSNAGSCDLSLIHVPDSLSSGQSVVTRTELKSAAGPLRARPTMVVARAAPATTEWSTCDEVTGSVYVAFEGCHLLARIDLATGNVIDGVQTLPGEPPKIVGPEVSCPVECGAPPPAARPQEADAAPPVVVDAGAADAATASAPDAAPPPASQPVRPSALAIEPDGTRLYAGDIGNGSLLIIDLDAMGAPTAARFLPLEGAGGITRLAASGVVEMGDRGGSRFHFVYAIGADTAIHVADVSPGRAPRECDTQLDRRYLHDFTTRDRLACFEVGDPRNAPRRADARGPGIRLPNNVVPLDITFIQGTSEINPTSQQPAPGTLFGTFAMVTADGPVADSRTGRGVIYVINVDDDNYEDTETNESDSKDLDIALAIPHVLRDGIPRRQISAPGCVETDFASGSEGPPRISSDSRAAGFIYADTGVPGDAFAPGLHRLICDSQHANYELGVTAPRDMRETLFADLEKSGVRNSGLQSDDTIAVQWEGVLTFDDLQSQRRGGRMTQMDSSRLALSAPGGLLCGMGVEEGDVLRLVGCNSELDCTPGEVCITHPDAPSGVNGLCVPDKNARDLSAICRELLVSLRRYTVTDVHNESAVLMARPSVFPGSPIEGCVSGDQCAKIEDALLKPIEAATGTPSPRHEFVCENDDGIGGVPLCIAKCTTDADCDSGSVCAGERCVLGPIPPPVCLAALQRYEMRAGDSFIVKSSAGSFSHRRITSSDGRCVDDMTRSPLIVNRIRRVEPDCTDLSVHGEGPNPCHIPDLQEPYKDPSDATFKPRDAYGMRIRSPGLTFDLTDVAFDLTLLPAEGMAAQTVRVSHIPPGFQYRFNIAGGFVPYTLTLNAAVPDRIKVGPDGIIWVTDSGDFSASVRGQVIFLTGVSVQDVRLR